MDIALANIGELVESRPGAIGLLHRHGIDCSRSRLLSLREAAAMSGLDPAAIAAQLARLPVDGRPVPKSARALVSHIQHRYHQPHLNALFTALRLARGLESARPTFPKGLPAHIRCLAELVEAHQEKESDTVFPAILFSPRHNLRFPVIRVMMEHDEISDELDTIATLARSDPTPADAQPLYDILRQIDEEIRLHIYLENTRLYARYTGDRAAP